MNFNRKILTLDEFTIQGLRDFPKATGELSSLLRDMGLAAKRVHVEVNKAGLVDILGDAGTVNVQGEEVKKLDVYANETFMQTLVNREIVCGIASEENDDFITIKGKDECHNNKYVVLIDPLDGSSNIDVNVSVGTIFFGLQEGNTCRDTCNHGRFSSAGCKPGSCRLYCVRFVDHAGLCHPPRGERFYAGSFDRGVDAEPSRYQVP